MMSINCVEKHKIMVTRVFLEQLSHENKNRKVIREIIEINTLLTKLILHFHSWRHGRPLGPKPIGNRIPFHSSSSTNRSWPVRETYRKNPFLLHFSNFLHLFLKWPKYWHAHMWERRAFLPNAASKYHFDVDIKIKILTLTSYAQVGQSSCAVTVPRTVPIRLELSTIW